MAGLIVSSRVGGLPERVPNPHIGIADRTVGICGLGHPRVKPQVKSLRFERLKGEGMGFGLFLTLRELTHPNRSIKLAGSHPW